MRCGASRRGGRQSLPCATMRGAGVTAAPRKKELTSLLKLV